MSKTVSGRTINGETVTLEVNRLVWRPAVYAIITDDAGRVLMLHNAINNRRELPGGGVELGEPMASALVREVWEETGLSVTIGALVYADDCFCLTPTGKHWHTIRHFFRATISGGQLRDYSVIDDEQVSRPHWVDVANLRPDDMTIGYDAIEAFRQG